MKSHIKFEADIREKTGRGEARALRRSGQIPAILYSKDVEPVSLALTEKELVREYLKGGFSSKLLEVSAGKKSYFALARNIQTHPVSDRIEHLDLLEVKADSKISVEVPVRVINADRSIGLKRGGALNVVRHTVALICSPENIPSKITVDIKDAHIGDSIHISQIALPDGVVPAIQDRDFTVATIAGRIKAEDKAADAEAGEAAEGEAAAE